MVLNKRILRNLKSNFIRYLMINVVLILGIGVSVAYANVYESVKHTVFNNWTKTNVENGEFLLHKPLSKQQITGLEKLGAKVQETYYVDFTTNKLTIRVFKQRDNINLINLYDGKQIQGNRSIILDKVFAKDNELVINKSITLGGKDYKVCGTATVPDYLQRVRNLSDAGTTSKFGIAFVSNEEFKDICDKNKDSVVYNYCYKLNGASDNQIKNYLFSMDKIVTPFGSYDNLYDFTTKQNNSRITYGYTYTESEKSIGIIASIIIGCLIAYIISVFAVKDIDDESACVGTLYALGYDKRKLISHYIKLPVIVTMIGALLGCIAGRYLTELLITSAFSYPKIEFTFPIYMIIFGFVIPVLLSFFINYLAINKKLSAMPLELIRHERKGLEAKQPQLKTTSFLRSFRIRQFFSEKKSYIIMIFGLVISMLVMMIGVAMNSTISEFARKAKNDVSFQTMYILTAQPEKQPDDTQCGYTKSYSLHYDKTNQYVSVLLEGISDSNTYFKFSSKLKSKKDGVYLSSAVAKKFGYSVGDTVTFDDLLYGKKKKMHVEGIVDYNYGFFIFMNIDSMRKSYGVSSNYYNTLFSSKKKLKQNLSIENETTKEDVNNMINSWVKLGKSEFFMFSAISLVIFVIVVYLLVKSMIERSIFNISLLKVLGYSNRDTSKIYVNNNVYIIILAAIIGIPVSRAIIEVLVNIMTSGMKCFMPCFIGSKEYIKIVFIIAVSYLISMILLKKHINKISFTEILKNRE